jgi:PAS domain-containing protein
LAIWTDRAIFDENNNIVEYQGVGRDITEQKKIELALIKSEKQYRQLVENLNEGIWLVNKDADTLFVNKTMADMLGYRTDES